MAQLKIIICTLGYFVGAVSLIVLGFSVHPILGMGITWSILIYLQGKI